MNVKLSGALVLSLALLCATTAPAAEADAWSSSVARLISRNQSYPRSAQIRGEEGTTRLKVTLAADGKIASVELTASSGSPILDREAQAIITHIGKFPAPPAGIRALTVPIVWRLH